MKSSSAKAVKLIAVILGVLGIIAAFGVAAMGGERFNFGLFACAAAAALILAVLLYGFGELIDNTAQIKYMSYELNARIRELEVKLERPAAQPAAPVQSAAAPEKAAAEKKEIRKPAVNVPAPYEKLESAAEIYEYFCETHKDHPGEDAEACADRLQKIAYREQGGFGNSKNNALSLLKSYYKHDCRIFAVDRSGSSFRCPACGNKIFSDRKSCHHCGALFRI